MTKDQKMAIVMNSKEIQLAVKMLFCLMNDIEAENFVSCDFEFPFNIFSLEFKRIEKHPKFPKEEDEKTIENIINQWPKTDNCEFQTLGELREWQIKELKKFFNKRK